jgi:hypothetical protein
MSGMRTVSGGRASASYTQPAQHAHGVWGRSSHDVMETVPEAPELEAGAVKGKK